MRALAIVTSVVIASAPLVVEAQIDSPLTQAIEGESAATAWQREVIERWARLAAMRARLAEDHPELVAARDALRAQLASAPRERADRAAVLRWVRAQLADVDARLAELSVSCNSGSPDVRSAEARRAALRDALAAIERRGTFTPRPTR